MPDEFANHDPADDKQTSVSDSDGAGGLSGPSADRDPFEELASEFAERQRLGQKPSVEEYAAAHPDLAEEIRELFPTIAAMEQLKSRKAAPLPRPTLGGLPLEQLGDFRILGEIGRGGMGVVYEAEQVSLGRHVAVKVLPKQALLDERHLRRFEREAQTAAKLHHTNIVPVFGVGQQDGYHYIVMQFIPGVGLDEVLVALRQMVLGKDSQPLESDSSRASHASHNAKALLDGQFQKQAPAGFSASLIKANSSTPEGQASNEPTLALVSTKVIPDESAENEEDQSKGKLAALTADQLDQLAGAGSEYFRSVARIGAQVADALQYAHEQGTLHRDIKPGNLLLDSTGTVWVADFGLAKLAEHENVSRTGDIVGTLAYMPPESFSGETDTRSDTYSLGLTLYELLVLRPAYVGNDRGKMVRQITEGELTQPSRLNRSVPRDLETIVLKAVSHQPEDRYATAGDLAEDLQRYLDDRPILARRASAPERLVRWCRRNRLVASLAASVLSLLVLLTVTLSIGYVRAEQGRVRAVALTDAAESAQKREAQEKVKAELKAKEAQETASLALVTLIKIFDRLAPSRLPLSADTTLQGSSEEDDDAEIQSELAGETEEELVAPPPVTEEAAAMLAVLLEPFDQLSQRAGDEGEFALTSADLTRRVGLLHFRLGKSEEATEAFAKAIEKYRSLVTNTESPAAIVGLAMSLNDLGTLLGSVQGVWEAHHTYGQALELLRQHAEALRQSPRAQYELARTLFLLEFRPMGSAEPPMARPGGRLGERNGRGGKNRGRGEREHPGRFPPEQRASSRDSNLREAIQLLEELADGDPRAEYRYLLARCYKETALSDGFRPQIRDDQGLAKAIEILELLVQEHANQPDYQFELAMSYGLKVGGFYGQTAADEELCRKVATIMGQLTSTHANVADYARFHVISAFRLATTLRYRSATLDSDPAAAAAKLAEAAQWSDKASEAVRGYLQRFPRQSGRKLGRMIDFQFMYVGLLRREHQDKRAREILVAMISNLERIANVTDPLVVQVNIGRANLELGRSLQRAGESHEAEKKMTEGVAALRRVVEARQGEDNEERHHRFLRYSAALHLVTALHELGKPAEAEAAKALIPKEVRERWQRGPGRRGRSNGGRPRGGPGEGRPGGRPPRPQ